MTALPVETVPYPNCGARPQWGSAVGAQKKIACECGVSGPWVADDGRHAFDAARSAWNRTFVSRPGPDSLRELANDIRALGERLEALEAQSTGDRK